MVTHINLGAAIKKSRKENKLTQEKLAELLNVTPVHVKQIEAGTRLPSVEVLYRISVTLNFSVDAVFFPQKCNENEMLHKIEWILRLCTPHDLQVVYATACALTSNNLEQVQAAVDDTDAHKP